MRTEGTKFVTYHQNNSGGYYILNEDVQHYVIIEGFDLWQIEAMANRVFADHSQYCKCCGERWHTWIHENNMKNEPMIYEYTIEQFKKGEVADKWYRGDRAIIYYLNGIREIVDLMPIEDEEDEE